MLFRRIVFMFLSCVFCWTAIADTKCPIGYELTRYVQLEYIESTGTQYIDTEFEGNLNTRFFVEFEPTRGSSDYNSAIIGGSMINSTQVITILIPIASGMSRTNRFGNKELQFPDNKCFLNNKYTIETDKNSIRLDGVPQGYFNTTNNFQTNTTLYIFNINQSNIQVGNLRIYKSKIWDNDVLVRDFIPVLDVNNIPCMLDKVEGKFYYNQGTGEFIAGPEVELTQRFVTDENGDIICTSCPANTYKPNAGNEECTPCPEHTFSPVGSKELSDCARILHVGEHYIYMPVGKRTEHGLCTMLDGVKYCADVYERQ
ncbi:MAG: hypothetical protein MJ170_01950 [Alphaproteobacteria bacterium]|nr:hypothetical protein [Alphaproteobacteria bacterium]